MTLCLMIIISEQNRLTDSGYSMNKSILDALQTTVECCVNQLFSDIFDNMNEVTIIRIMIVCYCTILYTKYMCDGMVGMITDYIKLH